jgi:hypothetical protein
MTLEMNIFNICKQPGDDNDLPEVDLIEEFVYDQFESTLSKIEFDKYKDLQLIYSRKKSRTRKAPTMLSQIIFQN